MPFEVFIIAIVAISVGAGAVITIVKSVLGYLDRREERRLGVGRAGGVTTSELKGLLREAVEEATAPLVERLEALERQRPAAGLPGHDPHRLPEPQTPADTAAPPPA